jgi:hypothetical protein
VRTNPAPACLAKRGLLTIDDNLAPGQEVSFHRMFCLIFRSELEARIFTKSHTSCTAAPSGSSRFHSE